MRTILTMVSGEAALEEGEGEGAAFLEGRETDQADEELYSNDGGGDQADDQHI